MCAEFVYMNNNSTELIIDYVTTVHKIYYSYGLPRWRNLRTMWNRVLQVYSHCPQGLYKSIGHPKKVRIQKIYALPYTIMISYTRNLFSLFFFFFLFSVWGQTRLLRKFICIISDSAEWSEEWNVLKHKLFERKYALSKPFLV